MDKQPNHLKLLHGNPGRKKLKPEMKPEPAIPPMPYIVRHNRFAKAEWLRITPELYRQGIISELDQAALAALCMSVAMVTQLQRELNLLPVGSEEYLRIARAVRQSTIQMSKCLADFGMTPKSRKRVTPVINNSEPDEFEKWEQGQK